MYLARFEVGSTALVSSAWQWTSSGGALLPGSWLKKFSEHPKLDFALRARVKPEEVRVSLLINAEKSAEFELVALCKELLARAPPQGTVLPSNAAEFDSVAGNIPAWHLRVAHEGYHHLGTPLACDFRLYRYCCRIPETREFIYQAHLRSYQPGVEMRRGVLKYLARLDLEKPFTSTVRTMQQKMAERLLENGWLGAEFLAAAESEGNLQWLPRIREHFGETAGRMGFSEAPIEVGDFSDWLQTGCHPARFAPQDANLVSKAATVFTQEELTWMVVSNFAKSAGSSPSGAQGGKKPRVFISYASDDFTKASALCSQLESNGFECWIAPRDIERDILPYPDAITKGISAAQAVVVLLSETANLSVHIPRELDLALSRRLTIVPVRLQEVLPEGQLRYFLGTCQWLNAFNRDFNESVNELLVRLGKLA